MLANHPHLGDILARVLSTNVEINVDLGKVVRWKVGGIASVVLDPSTSSDISAVYGVMKERPEPLFLMGDASNLLFDSRGFNGVILRIGRSMSEVRLSGTRIYAQAGVWVPSLAHFSANAGLSGLEHTIGIPGTLGGLVVMNGGSQRKGIGLNVVRVDCINSEGHKFSLNHQECGFGYRSSSLQSMEATVVGVELELIRDERPAILRRMIQIMESRKARFPKNLPNGGSTFLSNPEMYDKIGAPGQIIEKLGLKGVRRGEAQISPQHANFIVNLGGAHSDDILWLIHLIRNRVYESTGYWMDCEVRFVSFDGKVYPAHEAANLRYS